MSSKTNAAPQGACWSACSSCFSSRLFKTSIRDFIVTTSLSVSIKLPADSAWGWGWGWSVLAGRRPTRPTVFYFSVRSPWSSKFSNRWPSWFKCTEFSLRTGLWNEIFFWGSGPKKAAHLDDLKERKGTVNSLVARKQRSPLLIYRFSQG